MSPHFQHVLLVPSLFSITLTGKDTKGVGKEEMEEEEKEGGRIMLGKQLEAAGVLYRR